jgi:hypothetical protein
MYTQSTAPVLVFYLGVWAFMTIGGFWFFLAGGLLAGLGLYLHFKSRKETREASNSLERLEERRRQSRLTHFSYAPPPDWP